MCHMSVLAIPMSSSERLKRAGGHLRHVITIIEARVPCQDTTRQLSAVESAVTAAKPVLIFNHIDHCLDQYSEYTLAEMKALSKLL